MNTYPLISIILPNLNTKRDVLEFLESVNKQNYPKQSLEIVVTDNGSIDGSQDAIENWFTDHRSDGWYKLHLVISTINMGIAFGYNIALEHSSWNSWAIIRAESDVIWPSDLVINLVDDLIENPQAGIIGPKGVYHDNVNKVDHAARYISWWTGKLIDIDASTLVQCDAVIGSTFILSRTCIDRLGYLFENGRFLASELELCTRVKRLGYQVIYDPKVEIKHKVAHTSSLVNPEVFQYIDQKELLLFHMKFNPIPQRIIYLLYTVLLVARRLMRGKKMDCVGFIDGLMESINHRSYFSPSKIINCRTLIEWIN